MAVPLGSIAPVIVAKDEDSIFDLILYRLKSKRGGLWFQHPARLKRVVLRLRHCANRQGGETCDQANDVHGKIPETKKDIRNYCAGRGQKQ